MIVFLRPINNSYYFIWRHSVYFCCHTIQSFCPSKKKLVINLSSFQGKLILIGDMKGPSECQLPCVDFYDISQQNTLPFSLSKKLPIPTTMTRRSWLTSLPSTSCEPSADCQIPSPRTRAGSRGRCCEACGLASLP